MILDDGITVTCLGWRLVDAGQAEWGWTWAPQAQCFDHKARVEAISGQVRHSGERRNDDTLRNGIST